jgi:hypothetical protein
MIGKDTVSNVLRTLAVQILHQNPDIIPFVHQEYYEKGLGRSAMAMRKLLRDVLTAVSSVRIVVDGLDECEDVVQKELLAALLDFQKVTGQPCKVLVSSRPDHTKDSKHITDRKLTIKMRGETGKAIQAYIKNEVRML